MRAATRVNTEQASKVAMWKPTRHQNGEGRRLGQQSEGYQKFSRILKDPRNPDLIKHRQIDILRQRIYGLACGYEDLNDHDVYWKSWDLWSKKVCIVLIQMAWD